MNPIDYSRITVSMRPATNSMAQRLYRIGFLRYFRMSWFPLSIR